jgi:nicotinamide-nucleotide amidase
MSHSDDSLLQLAKQVAEAAHAGGWRISTAESCTGGWVARCFTDLAGSSAWFEGGWVVYSNALKQHCLNVPAEDLSAYGAVSREVVECLSAQARGMAGVDLAVAISGVAGPGGGSAGKQVGTVWFSWTGPGENATQSRCCHFDGDREAVRRSAVAVAMQGLIDCMQRAE